MKKLSLKNSTMQFLKFVSENEGDNIDVLFTKGDLWASQKMISLLFGIGVPAVSKHIKNIFGDRELDDTSVVSNLETTASDGKRYDVDYYNLDIARQHAENEFEKYRVIQDRLFESDFDNFVKQISI